MFNPWQYASKRMDPDLGVIDFGKRYYDPLLGRWFSLDPAGFINSHNLYQYNFNNPFRYTDSDGQFALLLPILCLGFDFSLTWVVTTEVLTASATITSVVWAVSEITSKKALSAKMDLVLKKRPQMIKKKREGKKAGIISQKAGLHAIQITKTIYPILQPKGLHILL